LPDAGASRRGSLLPGGPPRAIKWVIINAPWYQSDRATPLAVRRRINGVLGLVDNLAAIDRHARRLPATLMPRLVTLTGATSRLLSRFAPPDRRRRS
jgi:hypothetical protein